MRLLDPVRSVFFNVAFYGFSILFLALAVTPVCFFGSEKAVRKMVVAYCRGCIWIARWIMGIKVDYRGTEHCPPEGAVMLAAAHQSNMDPMLTICLRGDVTALAKKELFTMPLVGRILKKMNIVRIDRQSRNAHKDMDKVGKEVQALGKPLIVYPQATRTAIGQKRKLKSGAYFLHKDTQIPVIPIATNTGLFWRKGFFHRSGTVVFEMGPALPGNLDKEEFMAQIEKWVVQKSDQLVIEAGYGHLLSPADRKAVG